MGHVQSLRRTRDRFLLLVTHLLPVLVTGTQHAINHLAQPTSALHLHTPPGMIHHFHGLNRPKMVQFNPLVLRKQFECLLGLRLRRNLLPHYFLTLQMELFTILNCPNLDLAPAHTTQSGPTFSWFELTGSGLLHISTPEII